MVIIMSSKQPNLNNILMKQAMRKAIDNINFIDSIYYQHSAYMKLKKLNIKHFTTNYCFLNTKLVLIILLLKVIYNFIR